MKKTIRFALMLLLAAAMLLFTACSPLSTVIADTVTAVTEKETSSDCSLAGKYTLYTYEKKDLIFNKSQLERMGLDDTIYIEINQDGTGEISLADEGIFAITVDESKNTFHIDTGEIQPFSVSGSQLVLPIDDITYTFKNTESSFSDNINEFSSLLESEECSIAGNYAIKSIVTMDGAFYDKEALKTVLPVDEYYVNIYYDGFCEISLGADAVAFGIVKEESYHHGVITDATGTDYSYTIADSELLIDINEENILSMCFVKKDAEQTEILDEPDYWYGWIALEDNSLYDVWCVLATDEDTNKPYIELFEDVNEDPVVSMYISVESSDEYDLLIPEIGEDDAWIYDMTLEPGDEDVCFMIYEDGELSCGFDTADADGFEILAVVRPEGAEWPEDRLLPPGMEG